MNIEMIMDVIDIDRIYVDNEQIFPAGNGDYVNEYGDVFGEAFVLNAPIVSTKPGAYGLWVYL